MTAPVCPECGSGRIVVFYKWAAYEIAAINTDGIWEDGEQVGCEVDYCTCADCGHDRRWPDTFHPEVTD